MVDALLVQVVDQRFHFGTSMRFWVSRPFRWSTPTAIIAFREGPLADNVFMDGF